ncbi:zinc finger C2HC domain-containing protein 1A-like [Ylistrum balloti]|uniref:zinc finger C2HC domain-containing protein 1A-like n=1 Tax=Ylistrum balloti TaxID=509963 RepID=UPI002905C943|nr:zinc finger C2HC domain-containing protein 1A-like [Ylistrum balloti]
MADQANMKIQRKPCRSCGRQFVQESLAKHEPICMKQAAKKRKVFDSTKQRAEGTEVSYRQMKQAQKKEVRPPKTNWRAQHQDFINTVRSARQVTVAMERGDPLPPPPPPSINPDYVQCPHCGRRFNEKAAARHIGFCQEQQKRISTKPQPNANAKAKMDARNSYQPPKLKSKGVTPSPSTGYSSPGARGSPAATRGAPAARASPSSGQGRTPVGTTGSGYGRQPAPASRGRPSPSTNQYQAIDYSDSSPTGLEGSAVGVPTGRALRTGRNSAVYNDAKRGTRPGSTGMPKSKSSSSIRVAGAGSSSPAFGSHSPSMPSGFTGGITRENESGYYSSSSENEVHSQYGSKQNVSRFCHECGTKYPISTAKFCCECGIKRFVIS